MALALVRRRFIKFYRITLSNRSSALQFVSFIRFVAIPFSPFPATAATVVLSTTFLFFFFTTNKLAVGIFPLEVIIEDVPNPIVVILPSGPTIGAADAADDSFVELSFLPFSLLLPKPMLVTPPLFPVEEEEEDEGGTPKPIVVTPFFPPSTTPLEEDDDDDDDDGGLKPIVVIPPLVPPGFNALEEG